MSSDNKTPETPDAAAESSVLFLKHLRLMQEEIGIDGEFLQKLFSENDWSFVVKLHALVEGAMTHLLVEALGRPELRDVFANTDLSNTRSGKLVFATALGLIEPGQRRFVRELSELRNLCVHDVRNVRLDLVKYVEEWLVRDAGEARAFIRAIGYFAPGDRFSLGRIKDLSTFDFCRENPKLAIWFSALNLVAFIYVAKETEARRRDADSLAAFAKRLGALFPGGLPPLSTPVEGGA